MFAPALLLIPARTFDLTFPAASVSRVVAQLAAKSGESLAVDPAVGKEIVAIRLPKTDLQGAMSRLATALDASWRSSGSGVVLVRTSEDLSKERLTYAALCRRAFRESYGTQPIPPFAPEESPKLLQRHEALKAKYRDRVPSPKEMTEWKALVEQYFGQQPLLRLVRRLEVDFDPAFCDRFGAGHVVFHSQPNARQRPLTAAQSAAFDLYLREDAEFRRLGIEEYNRPTSPNRPAQIEIICDLEKTEARSKFRILDRRGVALIGQYAGGLSIRGLNKPHLEKRPPETGFKVGVRIDHTQKYEQLADMTTNDPLSTIGQRLVECAEARQDDLIAILGDDLLGNLMGDGMTPEACLTEVATNGYEVKEVGEYLQIAPFDRVKARLVQSDRPSLKEFLDLNAPGRSPTMNDLVRLSTKLPLYPDSTEMAYWQSEIGVRDSDWNTPVFRIISRLPRGRDLLLNSLSADLRDPLAQILIKSGPGDFRRRSLMFREGFDLSPDSTDVPTILSPGTSLRIDETLTPCFTDPGSYRPSGQIEYFYTADQIKDGSQSEFKRVGKVHRLELTVHLGPGVNDVYRNRVEALELDKPAAH